MATRPKAQSASSRIRGATRREDTIVRLGGDGYIAAMTWTADDWQLVAIIDGAGWPEIPQHDYSMSRLFALSGSPQTAVIEKVSGYPDLPIWTFLGQGGAQYYALNALAVDGRVYQFMSTTDRYGPDENGKWSGDFTGANFTHAKLIYSPDNGRTWCNQDGSTPATWESRRDQSRDNMVFFQEPQDAFSQLSFLQMGKDYQDNRDGYVYVYAPNGRTEGTMNELVMFRVPKEKILDRGAYEYFARLRDDGDAEWVKDINARGVVHTFPRGLVPEIWPLSWVPSVGYNAPLGVYMMANSCGITASCMVSRPTYLGLWVADHPWGPWRQIHEETAWTPAGDPEARAAAPLIAPKWIAEDGKSFWLVWTDAHQTTSEDLFSPIWHVKTREEWIRLRRRWREVNPYFGFNTQRVELVMR